MRTIPGIYTPFSPCVYNQFSNFKLVVLKGYGPNKMKNYHFQAVIFDLDGVVTDTAAVHSAAWKSMFNEFLACHAERTNTTFQEFTHEGDYLPFVDGKPRYKGVESFLRSRGIDLPFGSNNDPPNLVTICGLGNRKNQLFNEALARGDIIVFQSTVRFIHTLIDNGIRIGVASSSKKTVLEFVGLLDLFETRVDGIVSVELGLKGKPQPDIFMTACDNLEVPYDQAVIVEDAVSGVQAGRNGGFGLVLGIAREQNSAELKRNGADIVISDLDEIDLETIDSWFDSRSNA
jgi:HAD superfamily hydrolase (TIGR01509 family)